MKVFFSKRPESDADFTVVFPVMRRVGDAGVAHGALDELLRGPTPEEQAAGYFSEIGMMLVGPSNCGGEPFTLSLDAGAATLKFCQMVSSAGIGQDARTQAALEATLRQFSTIQRVRVLYTGRRLPVRHERRESVSERAVVMPVGLKAPHTIFASRCDEPDSCVAARR